MYTALMNMLTQLLTLTTATITLVTVLLALRKAHETAGKIDVQTSEIKEIHNAADGARESLHNHLAMIEAGIAAAAAMSERKDAP